MADGFEYFKSTDVGAPVMNGAAGRLIAVLDWVLVAKGGWEKAYTGTNLASYRSLSGNRFYLAVDDTQTTLGRLRGYRSMSAVSTGTDMFPTTNVASASSWGVSKSSGAGASARRYWGVRTNRYVFLVIEQESAGVDYAYRNAMAFGDVPSLCEADGFNTIVMGAINPSTMPFPSEFSIHGGLQPQTGLSISSAVIAMAATPNGLLSSPITGILSQIRCPTFTTTANAVNSHTPGRMFYFDMTIWSANNLFLATQTAAYPRARMPNVKMGGGIAPMPGLADLEVITIGAKQFLLLVSATVAGFVTGYMLLEITDTDDIL